MKFSCLLENFKSDPEKTERGRLGKKQGEEKEEIKERRCVRRLEERRKGGEKTKREVSDRKCEMK